MKEAGKITEEIRSLISLWEDRLLALDEKILTVAKNSQNRTIRQIMGHLIDSASNNTHRVVHLQYQNSPFSFPNYASHGNNDRWIAIQHYQDEEWNTIVNLWKYSMLHYCHIISYIDDSKLRNEWISGPGATYTLEAMILDFPRHLKLHLSEIEELIMQD
jgi:hypothetical protein